ncbi:hypothetical protein [Streptomyces sp. NPDC002521]
MSESIELPQQYTITIDLGIEGYTTRTVTVAEMEWREETNELGTMRGLFAKLTMPQQEGEQPTTYFLSRLVGERQWVIDAKFGAAAFPHYSHGFGTRLTARRTLIEPVEALLDATTRALGLALQIDPGVPLAWAPRNKS